MASKIKGKSKNVGVGKGEGKEDEGGGGRAEGRPDRKSKGKMFRHFASFGNSVWFATLRGRQSVVSLDDIGVYIM